MPLQFQHSETSLTAVDNGDAKAGHHDHATTSFCHMLLLPEVAAETQKITREAEPCTDPMMMTMMMPSLDRRWSQVSSKSLPKESCTLLRYWCFAAPPRSSRLPQPPWACIRDLFWRIVEVLCTVVLSR